MTSENLIERARRLLASYQPQRLEEEGAIAPAAVLILLHEREGVPHVLLTERTHQVEHHKGQISFPGGASDPGDGDLQTTALRETFEEIGVRPEDVEIIGRLDDTLTISNFNVTPYVGILNSRSADPFAINTREVAAIIEVPLPHLLHPDTLEWEPRMWKGEVVAVPAYTYGRHRIWGVTARILKGFLDLLSHE